MKEISIYLTENIKKGHENERKFFELMRSKKTLSSFCSFCKLNFLNPAIRTDDLSDQKSVFGRNMA